MLRNLFIAVVIFLVFILLLGCTPKYYEVELQIKPEGAGEVTGEGTYRSGEEVTLIAEPKEGYEFSMWTEGEAELSTDREYKFEIKKDRHLTAVFKEKFTMADKALIELISKEAKVENIFVTEDYREGDWSFDKVFEAANTAYNIYYRHLQIETIINEAFELSSDVRKELYKGDFTVNVPGVREYADKVRVDFDEIYINKNEMLVNASIKFPHIEKGSFAGLEKEIENLLLKEKSAPLNLEDIFVQALKQQELSSKEVCKSLVIKKDNGKLQITHIDTPENLFASFDELYKKAVAEKIDKVNIKANADNIITPETYAYASFKGTELPIINLDPYYLAKKTDIILADGTKLSLEVFWKELQELEGTVEPFIEIGPDSFFYHIRFGETSDQGRKTVYLTRRYAVLTMDSVVGYIDMDTNKVKLIEVISGPGESASELYWSPKGNYVAYYWTASGSGFNYLHAYDVEKDEVISFYNLIETTPQEAEAEVGEFYGLKWTEEEKLIFSYEKPQWIEDKDTETFTWQLLLKEKTLKRLN